MHIGALAMLCANPLTGRLTTVTLVGSDGLWTRHEARARMHCTCPR